LAEGLGQEEGKRAVKTQKLARISLHFSPREQGEYGMSSDLPRVGSLA
jgi:hypothetical protein